MKASGLYGMAQQTIYQNFIHTNAFASSLIEKHDTWYGHVAWDPHDEALEIWTDDHRIVCEAGLVNWSGTSYNEETNLTTITFYHIPWTLV